MISALEETKDSTKSSVNQDQPGAKKETRPTARLPHEEPPSCNPGRDEFEYQRQLFFGK
jgi:hypothetical protein